MRRYLLVGGSKSPTDDPFMGTGKIPMALLLKFHTIQALTDSTALIESVVTTECAKVLKVVTMEEAAVVVPKDGSTTTTTKNLCIERMTPFTKDLLHGHLSRSLYVSQLPLTPDGTKYAISQEELRALFTPLLSSVTPPSTDTAATTTETTSSNMENNNNNNNNEDGIALIKFKFQPRHPNNNHHHKNDSKNQKWQPTGGAMMEFTNVTTLQRVAEQTLTTNPDQPPKVPLYYQPPPPSTGSSSSSKSDDPPQKIPLQVMLYSDYHKQERRESSNNSGDKSHVHHDNDDQPDAAATSFTMDWKPGCVIRIQGISNAKEEKPTDDHAVVSTTTPEEIHCDRECLLELLVHGLQRKDMATLRDEKIVYVDYSRGQDHGAIRCEDPQHISVIYETLQQLVVVAPNVAGEPTTTTAKEEEAAITKEEATTEPVVDAAPAAVEPAVEKAAVSSKGQIPNRHRLQFESVTILSGDEEQQYWNDFIAFKNQQMNNNQQRHSSNNSKRKSNSSSNSNNYNKRSKHSHRR